MGEIRSDPGDAAARIERRWAGLSAGIVTFLVVMAAYAGIHQAVMPQARVEIADPATLHLAGEFIESNLGSACATCHGGIDNKAGSAWLEGQSPAISEIDDVES